MICDDIAHSEGIPGWYKSEQLFVLHVEERNFCAKLTRIIWLEHLPSGHVKEMRKKSNTIQRTIKRILTRIYVTVYQGLCNRVSLHFNQGVLEIEIHENQINPEANKIFILKRILVYMEIQYRGIQLAVISGNTKRLPDRLPARQSCVILERKCRRQENFKLS